MQPLYVTLLSYPKQYATALGNRLWKRNVLHYYAGLAQPFMEMAGKQSSNL